jgi:hypothetical protein
MKPLPVTVRVLLLLAASAVTAHADDGITLTVTRGPSPTDAALSWLGGVPNFDYFRSTVPSTVTVPGNSVLITGGRATTDAGVPPPGACSFYLVESLGPCAPLTPTTICGAGERCYPTTDHLTDCEGPVGTGSQGAACVTDADCASMYVCIAAPSNQCLKWCRIGQNDCPGRTCVGLNPSVFAGAQEYGVCL